MPKFYYVLLIAGMMSMYGSCKKTPPEPDPESYSLSLSFDHHWDNADVNYSSLSYMNASGNELSIVTFKYLISDIRLVKSDDSEVAIADTYGYINDKDNRISVELGQQPKGSYKAIKFKIGLEESINKGDPSKWGPEHPLNPLVSKMYWDWSSGYIFIQFEGTYKNSLGAENGYSYHIAFEKNIMEIEVEGTFDLNADKTLTIKTNIAEIFKDPTIFDINERGNVTHSTGDSGISADLSENFLNAFVID